MSEVHLSAARADKFTDEFMKSIVDKNQTKQVLSTLELLSFIGSDPEAYRKALDKFRAFLANSPKQQA